MKLLQALLYIGNGNKLTIYTNPIVHSLMDIIIFYLHNTVTHLDLYYSKTTQNSLSTFGTYSTVSSVILILPLLHFMIPPLSHMKLSYPLMGRKLVEIYWMMILPSHILLIQFQTHQPIINFQHKLIRMFLSKILM